MRWVARVSEDEMVALFLKTELHSLRFRDDLGALLESHKVAPGMIDQPDLQDPSANATRARLLGEWRGFRRGDDVFTYYPEQPEWHRCLLTREEIPEIRYINDSYWIELSGGTRRSGDSAALIRAGIELYGKKTDWALDLAREAAAGPRFPELILVTPDRQSPLTVLEGHVRLTAYCLALEHLPEELSALVGVDPVFVDV